MAIAKEHGIRTVRGFYDFSLVQFMASVFRFLHIFIANSHRHASEWMNDNRVRVPSRRALCFISPGFRCLREKDKHTHTRLYDYAHTPLHTKHLHRRYWLHSEMSFVPNGTTLRVKYLITFSHVRNQLSAFCYNKTVKFRVYARHPVRVRIADTQIDIATSNVSIVEADTNNFQLEIYESVVTIWPHWIWFTASHRITSAEITSFRNGWRTF